MQSVQRTSTKKEGSDYYNNMLFYGRGMMARIVIESDDNVMLLSCPAYIVGRAWCGYAPLH